MKQAFAFLLLGTAIAAIALWWTRDEVTPPDAVAPQGSSAPPGGSAASLEEEDGEPQPNLTPRELELLRLVSSPFGDAEREAVEQLVARADRTELEDLARLTAGLPSLRGRAFTLGVLLERYAEELGHDAALDLARELRAPDEILERLQPAPDLGALRRAGNLPPAERRAAFQRIAARAVQDDVYAVLAWAERLDSDARAELVGAVLREWAGRRPEELLRYVLDLDETRQQEALQVAGAAAFGQLAPERMLEIAENISGNLAESIRRAALMSLASTDPLAALHIAEALPPGPERAVALSLAARGYAAADPEAAVAWLQTSRPASPELVAAVAAGLARIDGQRAIELTLTAGPPNQQVAQLRGLIMSGALASEDVAALANRWATAAADTRLNLRLITTTWAARDPKAALDWLLTNADRASPTSIAQAAETLARNDPAAAAAYLDEIPAALRARWLKAAAQGYADRDVAAAFEWVASYAGEDGYDAAVAAIARRAARSDPPGAARILARIEAPSAADSLGAVSAIAAGWSARDYPAARTWAVSLPTGELRDTALTPVLVASVSSSGRVERSLLAEFSDAGAEQRALSEAVVALARTNPEAARRLVDDHALAPELGRYVDRLMQ